MNRSKNYTFHEYTYSFCPDCMKRVPAKIVFVGQKVFLRKRCEVHGVFDHILEEDKDFYLKMRQFDKPGTDCKIQTEVKRGCPYDCGLCADHEQHTCIGLIEVTNACNLGCPVCYASSGKGKHLSLDQIGKMMDFYQDSEYNKAEILQLSGGEPTVHPQILEIIKLAKEKKFQYVMLNTNGIKIAEDEGFVKNLGEFKGGFEVYLQFDSLQGKVYKHIRGKDILNIKEKAIANLSKYNVPVTLVSTIMEGVNDKEIGSIINYGLKHNNVRGINIQPVAFFGRLPALEKVNKRTTLTGILNRIEKQTSGMILKDDFVPLPCHVERVAFTYLVREGDSFIPITRNMDAKKYVPIIDNTFTFYPEDIIKKFAKGIMVCNNGNCFTFLKDFSKIAPMTYGLKSKKGKFEHVDNNTFRISVTSFIDAHNFDMKSIKKECVHIITPDLKKIPFSTYNMLYRKSYTDKYYK